VSLTDEEIDARLARIGRRIDSGRERTRAAAAREPGLLEFLDDCRERFGARLVWFRADGVEAGQESVRGVRPVYPDEEFKSKRRKG
jgi:hypothetical protein